MVAVTVRTAGYLEAIPGEKGPEEPVFGLCGAHLSRQLKAAAKAACVAGAERISGHSGRVGLAQTMVRNGAPLATVMRQGRWKEVRMVARYADNEEAGVALQYFE